MDSAIIVDVETTGLDADRDQIIELGYLEFVLEGDQMPAVVETYGGLEDPGLSITPEITKITGIENAHVKGRKIDWTKFRGALERAQVVIAHNMLFDRDFLEKREELKGLNLHWACSMNHIDWSSKGYKTKSLNYLAADHGFINPFAHRAVFDCAATFRLISPYIKELIERSYEKEFQVIARGAPFESKDVLKQSGYRWDPGQRVWSKVIPENKLVVEREFLCADVYAGPSRHEEVAL